MFDVDYIVPVIAFLGGDFGKFWLLQMAFLISFVRYFALFVTGT